MKKFLLTTIMMVIGMVAFASQVAEQTSSLTKHPIISEPSQKTIRK